MPRKVHLDTTKSSPSSIVQPVSKETNGAVTQPQGSPTSVASLVQGAAAARGGSMTPKESFSTANGQVATASVKGSQPTHQTHGAMLPPETKRITSVAQLLGNRGVAQGSIASFESLDTYRAHLEGLPLNALHRHALEDAKIVPIDDRARLIRRLESEFTATASKVPGHKAGQIPPNRPYTQQQMEAMNELKRKMRVGG